MPRLDVKPRVFWPPVLLLVAATVASGLDPAAAAAGVTRVNGLILDRFGGLFALGTFFMVCVVLAVAASPLGRLRLGGEHARPELDTWRWFSITLCSTIAIGILFWGAAEPLYHLRQPPAALGLGPGSPEAARFALSTMFMHWTVTPYAIYTVAGLAFALAHLNQGEPASLGAGLAPLLGRHARGAAGQLVDATCLFALVAGMAASLGAGVLTIAGGLAALTPLEGGAGLRLGVTALIVASFTTSSISGLHRGIRALSDLNVRVFLGLVAFVLLAGPTWRVLSAAPPALWEYARTFTQRSLMTGPLANDPWPASWTLFYWANWLAWAPVTGLFLGRIARGRTVRAFIAMNLGATALFGGLWMVVFSGTALAVDLDTGGALFARLQAEGAEAAVYALFDRLPASRVLGLAFVGAAFLSYVTAADSNTDAMSRLSQAREGDEAAVGLKAVWGLAVGVVAWVMVEHAGVDGVKALSVLGGFPALFLLLGYAVALLVQVWRAR